MRSFRHWTPRYIWDSQNILNVFLLILVLIIYWVILSTGDIQEDAFITFRTAFNLSDHGELSFNLGESHSGATSFLYPYFVAFVRILTGESAIISILIINSIALIASSFLFSIILIESLNISKKMIPIFWTIIAISPVTLLMAVRGMEAVYVVTLFVIGIWKIHKNSEDLNFLLPVIFLPLIRPDAIAFSLILAGFAFSKSTAIGLRYFIAAISGLILLLMLNYFIFGNIFPATMQAKAYAILDSRSLLKVFHDEVLLYFQSPLFSPVNTKFFSFLYPLTSLVALIGSVILLNRFWIYRRNYFFLILTIIAGIWLVPGAFGLGGIIYPWYLWPSQFFYQGLFAALLLYGSLIIFKDNFIRYGFPIILIILLPFILIQLINSINWGTQEMGYRASVGKYLKTQAKAGDVLFLEPAGYIPYFSEMKTIDEVGLASSVILSYKKISKDRWWIDFVKSEKPTFMVQRDHILDYKTYQGYEFSEEEKKWFNQNYEIIKKFEYNPEKWSQYSVIKKILKFGSHSDYYVLKIRQN